MAGYVRMKKGVKWLIPDVMDPMLWYSSSPGQNLARLTNKQRKRLAQIASDQDDDCQWVVSRKAFEEKLKSEGLADRSELQKVANRKLLEMMLGTILRRPTPIASTAVFAGSISLGAFSPFLMRFLIDASRDQEISVSGPPVEQLGSLLIMAINLFSYTAPVAAVIFGARLIASIFVEDRHIVFSQLHVITATALGVIAAILVTAQMV